MNKLKSNVYAHDISHTESMHFQKLALNQSRLSKLVDHPRTVRTSLIRFTVPGGPYYVVCCKSHRALWPSDWALCVHSPTVCLSFLGWGLCFYKLVFPSFWPRWHSSCMSLTAMKSPRGIQLAQTWA